jgi:hypothetical protein
MIGNIEIRFHLSSNVLALPMGPGRHTEPPPWSVANEQDAIHHPPAAGRVRRSADARG